MEGNWIVNPTRDELKKSDLEFIIAATEKNIMMVEGEAKECQEEDLVKALHKAMIVMSHFFLYFFSLPPLRIEIFQ